MSPIMPLIKGNERKWLPRLSFNAFSSELCSADVVHSVRPVLTGPLFGKIIYHHNILQHNLSYKVRNKS